MVDKFIETGVMPETWFIRLKRQLRFEVSKRDKPGILNIWIDSDQIELSLDNLSRLIKHVGYKCVPASNVFEWKTTRAPIDGRKILAIFSDQPHIVFYKSWETHLPGKIESGWVLSGSDSTYFKHDPERWTEISW